MVKMSHRYAEVPPETAIHRRAIERESDNRQLSVSPNSSRASTPSSVLSDRTSFSTARTTPEPIVPEPQKQIPILKISTPTPSLFFCADDIDDMSLELSKSPALQAALQSDRSTRALRPSSVPSSGVEFGVPQLFRSLCICDPKIRGYPIQLRSKFFTIGPRALKVGACHFLNLPSGAKDGCILSTRPGIDGRPQFILEYAGNLLCPETGLITYVLAAQMDVTETMRELAASCLSIVHKEEVSTSEVDQTFYDSDDESSCISDVLVDDDGDEDDDSDKDEDLVEVPMLGAHANRQFIYQARSYAKQPIDWIDVAAEEREAEPFRNCKRQTRKPASPAIASTNDPDLEDLHDLVKSITFFHKSIFTLRPAVPGQGSCWQIAYTSPGLYSCEADLRTGLSPNSPETLRQLGNVLAMEEPVTLRVKWGVKGLDKRMYCAPMFSGEKLKCWVCFLVDGRVPDFWAV